MYLQEHFGARVLVLQRHDIGVVLSSKSSVSGLDVRFGSGLGDTKDIIEGARGAGSSGRIICKGVRSGRGVGMEGSNAEGGEFSTSALHEGEGFLRRYSV